MASSSVERIKERLNIVDIVGLYVKLEKSGNYYRARCPFHNEKTPSFFVSPSRQTYHCFGCNQGGDIFTFVQEMEGLDFMGALRQLADRAGIEIARESSKDRTERGELYALLEAAAQFFELNISQRPDVRAYLEKRGLAEKTMRQFRVGYAKDEWSSLADYLRGKGYADARLEQAGIAIRAGEEQRSSRVYDRFRGRIMFPIMDSSGRAVGFSGRIFERGDKRSSSPEAKYVNTPETQLYQKSRILYGFDKAKQAIRQAGSCVIVEGQMDLLMSHQAGATHTVAVSGTALTGDHLKLLRRFTEKLIFAFDPDNAGFSASKRGIDLALAEGFDVSVAALPQGKDPADLIAERDGLWREKIKNATHIIDFYINALKERGYDTRTFRLESAKLVLPYVAILTSKIDQATFIGRLARAMGIAEEPVWEELKRAKPALSRMQDATAAASKQEPPRASSRKDMIIMKIAGIILWQRAAADPAVDVQKIERNFTSLADERGFSPEQIPQERQKELIFEAEMYFGENGNLEEAASELLLSLEEEILKERFSSAMEALRSAEERHDTGETNRLLTACQDISQRLNAIKQQINK